ncbi:hypothetical protein [Salipiger mucosus]|uniref:Phytanoyl-CoA dioxygenase family protein n=1 Tax=Salipiger mucosus DSM 16094 TaxID=1123237 RepID=S9Q5U6_9RHOB|nr:hypothetical protein [Salipiger mucosus]EPX76751.1 hypothetical protein Salmuc_04636 [Salipiger mucosus DSM 16094]
MRDIALQDITLPFSGDRFAHRRRPLPVGRLETSEIGTLPCCLDMLVKLPGEGVVLPDSYADNPAIDAFLKSALAFEDGMLPSWREECYLYLTIDQREVVPGRSHRNGGWHFDGMQGARYAKKLPGCHQYVMSSNLCTEFTDAPTDANGLDENRHNWFECLGEQIPDDTQVITPAPFEIVFMSAYQMHRSPVATEKTAGWRTFVRLDVSHKKQDRIGNTVNPDLPAPWEFVERNLPSGLGRPRTSTHWSGASRLSSPEGRVGADE